MKMNLFSFTFIRAITITYILKIIPFSLRFTSYNNNVSISDWSLDYNSFSVLNFDYIKEPKTEKPS